MNPEERLSVKAVEWIKKLVSDAYQEGYCIGIDDGKMKQKMEYEALMKNETHEESVD